MPATDKQVIAKLRRKGGKTVKELGDEGVVRKLAARGEIVHTGFRQTGRQGRPAKEYSLPQSTAE